MVERRTAFRSQLQSKKERLIELAKKRAAEGLNPKNETLNLDMESELAKNVLSYSTALFAFFNVCASVPEADEVAQRAEMADVDKQILKESQIRLKAAKTVCSIRSSRSAWWAESSVRKVTKELEEAYVGRPRTGVVRLVTKEIMKEFVASSCLYATCVNDLETTHQLPKKFLEAIYDFEDVAFRSDFSGRRLDSDMIAQRVAERQFAKSKAEADAKALADKKQSEEAIARAEEQRLQNNANAKAAADAAESRAAEQLRVAEQQRLADQQRVADQRAAEEAARAARLAEAKKPSNSEPNPNSLAESNPPTPSTNPRPENFGGNDPRGFGPGPFGPRGGPPSGFGPPPGFGPPAGFGRPGAGINGENSGPRVESFTGTDSVRITISAPDGIDPNSLIMKLQSKLSINNYSMQSNGASIQIGFRYSGELKKVVAALDLGIQLTVDEGSRTITGSGK